MPLRFSSIAWPVWLIMTLVVLVTVLLYAPFFSSPLVFDDHNFTTNLAAYDYAQVPFSRYPRTFPYFSLGFTHVLSGGDLAWNRYASIVLHAVVLIALYFFLLRALSRSAAEAPLRQSVVLAVCLWAALNPLAVYATGYLIQRTIVLATLGAIISTNLYLRAQQQARNADLFSAALLAGLAMMCKEHALLLPLAAVALTPFVRDWDRRVLGRAVAYLALSLPGTVWVLFYRGRGIVGTSYEIYAGQVMAQVAGPGGLDFPGGVWAMSVATQLLLFWKYLFLWFVPSPQWMSADLRIDFPTLWSGGWAYAGLFASLAVLLGAAVVWRRTGGRGKAGQMSAVLLFAAIPFAVELAAVRVQEPFVLYRSYLWMPAYALLLCFALLWGDAWAARRGVLARRVFWGALLVACAALFPLAQDRLRSFSSEEALWQDALHKLPRPDVAGADRIYYNLAGEAYKRKDFTAALKFSEQVVAQNPAAFQGYLAKGTSFLALGDLDAASAAFDEASAHQPPPEFIGYIEFKRCLVLEARGERAETIACIRRSAKMGYETARFHIKMRGLAESE